MKKKRRKNKNKTPLFSTKTLCIIFVPILLTLSYTVYHNTEDKKKELIEKRITAQIRYNDLEDEKSYLLSQIELFKEESYLLSYAKSKLMRVDENEILFVFPKNN